MKKKLILVSITFISLFLLFLVWFKATYSMEVAIEQEFYSINTTHKVLIATQGSEYKNGVVENIATSLKDKNVYLKVIDVSSLKGIKSNDWDAFIILYNWEIWMPEPNSDNFIRDNYDSSKMFVVSTSASGEFKIRWY